MSAYWAVFGGLDSESAVFQGCEGAPTSSQIVNQLCRRWKTVGVKIKQPVGASVVGHPMGAGAFHRVEVYDAPFTFLSAIGG